MSKRTIRIPYVGVGGATTTQRDTYACGTMQPCEAFSRSFGEVSEKIKQWPDLAKMPNSRPESPWLSNSQVHRPPKMFTLLSNIITGFVYQI